MNPEAIINLCNIHGIPEDGDEARSILAFYEKAKGEISDKEFLFVRELLRNAEERAGSKVRLQSAECSSEAFAELLSGFIKRYTAASFKKENPLLTELAEYAASGEANRKSHMFSVSLADKMTFPAPHKGPSEFYRIGDLHLTLSYGKVICNQAPTDICAVMSPSEGQNEEEFIDKVLCICRDYVSAHTTCLVKGVSEDGLLSDLASIGGGYVIDTRLLPVPGENIDAIFGVKPPSVLFFPRRENLHELWLISAKYGITPTAPIASRAKLITVRGGDVAADFTQEELSRLAKTTDACLGSCDSPSLSGETEVILRDCELKHSKALLSATRIGGGGIYESLADAMSDPDAEYAVCGILNEKDHSTLSMILTIDAYRRNTSASVIYSRFFMGEKTALYVFKVANKK